MRSTPVALRRWTTAALVSTLALLVLGGVLRAMGAALGAPEKLEDLRRLAGMLLGLCVVALAGTAVWRHRGQPAVLWPSLGAVGCVGLQGFLGTRSVAPGDRPAMIAAHLLVTLLLVGLLLGARESARASARDDRVGSGGREARPPLPRDRARVRTLALLTCLLIGVQVVLGARVRGALDLVILSQPELPRGQWLDALQSLPYVHRQVGGLVGVAIAALAVLAARCNPRAPAVGRAAATALVLCIGQTALGLTMMGRALPPDAQALHLPLAVVLFAVVFAVAQRAGRAVVEPAQSPGA